MHFSQGSNSALYTHAQLTSVQEPDVLTPALLHEVPKTEFRSVVHHLIFEHVERMVNNVRQSCRRATDCKVLSWSHHFRLPISVVCRRHHEGAGLVTSTKCRESKFTQIFFYWCKSSSSISPD